MAMGFPKESGVSRDSRDPSILLRQEEIFLEELQGSCAISQGGQQGGTSGEIRKQGEYVGNEATTALLQFLSWI